MLLVRVIFSATCVLAQTVAFTKHDNVSEFNITTRRATYEWCWQKKDDVKRLRCHCESFTCVKDAVERENKNINFNVLNCSEFYVRPEMRLVMLGKLPWQYVYLQYSEQIALYCRKSPCGIAGIVSYYYNFMQNYLNRFKHLTSNYCLENAPKRCWFYLKLYEIRSYFVILTLPLTFVCNFLNFVVISKILKNKSGSALYFHRAEIVTDFIVNLLIGLEEWKMFWVMSVWWGVGGCYDSRKIQVTGILESIVLAFQFLNQCLLLGLIFDRVLAVKKPLKYNSFNHNRRAKRGLRAIIFATFVLYVPLICVNTYFYDFFFSVFNKFDLFGVAPLHMLNVAYKTIPFALALAQIVALILLWNSKSPFVNSTTNNEERKKEEKDRRRLLIGTVGLNLLSVGVILATVIIYKIIDHYRRNYIWKRIDLEARYPTYINLFVGYHFVRLIETICVFSSGSLGFVFHIIFAKRYRTAFKDTVVRKCTKTE